MALMRAWCLLVLALGSLKAQVLGLPYFVQDQVSGGVDSTYVAYRWVASDLASNAAISGNWTDEIQGASWVQGASANQPTNSASGVWLDSTHFLTNGTLFAGSNVTFGAIWKVIDPGNFSSQLQDGFIYSRLPSQACGCGNEVYIGFTGSSSGVAPLASFCGAPSCYQAATPNPFPVTNVFSDMVMSQALTNTGGTGRLYAWTNGVLTALAADNNSFNAGSGANGYWGYGNTNQPATLGKNAFRSQGPKLYLAELWIWTNNVGSTGFILPTTQINNFHNYRVSKYGS